MIAEGAQLPGGSTSGAGRIEERAHPRPAASLLLLVRAVRTPIHEPALVTRSALRKRASTRGCMPTLERPGLGPSAQRGTGEAALAASASAVPTSTLLVTGAALQVAPNILSVAHWDRLLGGALYAQRAAFPRGLGQATSCAAPSTRTSRAAPGAQGA